MRTYKRTVNNIRDFAIEFGALIDRITSEEEQSWLTRMPGRMEELAHNLPAYTSSSDESSESESVASEQSAKSDTSSEHSSLASEQSANSNTRLLTPRATSIRNPFAIALTSIRNIFHQRS